MNMSNLLLYKNSFCIYFFPGKEKINLSLFDRNSLLWYIYKKIYRRFNYASSRFSDGNRHRNYDASHYLY